MHNQENNKRYVAHFDMLGFKSATLRNPDEAWGALSDLRACMDKIQSSHIEVLSTNEIISDRIYAHIFSDSLLIFTLSDEPKDLLSIVFLTSHLFGDALVKCIPLRGGISYGDFFFNPKLHLFCGVPFVRAYEIGERAQWAGIVLDDCVGKHYQNNSHMPGYDSQKVIKWNVPTKSNGKRNSWVINWPAIFAPRFQKKPPISVQDFYKAFESLFGPYDDLRQDIKTKYENTIEFVNSNLT